MTEDKVESTAQAALDKLADRIPNAKQELPRVVSKNPVLAAPYGSDSYPVIAGRVKGYEELSRVLTLAYDQASSGKGRERHSKQSIGFRPWHEQPILQIARMVGTGGHAYQVQKKVQEAVTMQGNGNYAGAKAEALGAIVYAAAFFKLLEEIEAWDESLNNLL